MILENGKLVLEEALGININIEERWKIQKFIKKRLVNPAVSGNFYQGMHAVFSFRERSECGKNRYVIRVEIFFQLVHFFGGFFLSVRNSDFYQN